jgi:hypothetical protein
MGPAKREELLAYRPDVGQILRQFAEQQNVGQVPYVAHPPLATPWLSGVSRPEPPTPLPDGLIRDVDPPLRDQFLDVAQAQAEPIAQPDGVTDDLRREPVSMAPLRSGIPP